MARPVTVQKAPDLPLWEEKFPRAVLERKASGREEGGSAMWLQGFRMQVVKPGDLKFPSFPLCCEQGILASEVLQRGWPTYLGVDLSSDSRPGNFISGVSVNPDTGQRVATVARNGAWTSPETAEAISDVVAQVANLQVVMVENNAYQDSLIDWVKKTRGTFSGWWQKIEAHTTGRNKADPTYGLPGLEVEFANRAWSFPAAEWEGHDPGHDCAWCVLSREFRLYPKYSTLDSVMSIWFCKAAIDKHAGRRRREPRRGDFNLR